MELGANVNNINRLQRTPIWEAAKRDNLGIVKLLLENKADLRIVPGHHYSLLLFAYLNNQNKSDVARFLYNLHLSTGDKVIISPYHEMNDQVFKILSERESNHKIHQDISQKRLQCKEKLTSEPGSNNVNSDTNQRKPNEDKKKTRNALAHFTSESDRRYKSKLFYSNKTNRRNLLNGKSRSLPISFRVK